MASPIKSSSESEIEALFGSGWEMEAIAAVSFASSSRGSGAAVETGGLETAGGAGEEGGLEIAVAAGWVFSCEPIEVNAEAGADGFGGCGEDVGPEAGAAVGAGEEAGATVAAAGREDGAGSPGKLTPQ